MKAFLVLNCGSSSIKYSLFDLDCDFSVLFSGEIERIGEAVADYHEGFALVQKQLQKAGLLEDFSTLFGAGHRVVHGGERFVDPVLIDEAVIEEIRKLIPLAPLHNPANLAGIEALRTHAPNLPQVAVFDTAFHQSIPECAYRYAVPKTWYETHGIRRFGFHGISHHYLRDKAAQMLGKKADNVNLITLHLGNGASAAAIKEGKSIDTSMGFTPLEGLVMGTRSGDLDPGILPYLADKGVSCESIDHTLNHESGLKALFGKSDMREILTANTEGNKDAALALEIFTRRIQKYIGAYLALLPKTDAIIFSGGIGYHSPQIRESVCAGLEHLGIALDPVKNREEREKAFDVTAHESRIKILVIETDEAVMIAKESCKKLL